jgi:hypothetical protein
MYILVRTHFEYPAAKYLNTEKRASSKLIVGSFSGQYSPNSIFFQPAASA